MASTDVWKLDIATWHQSFDGGAGEWNYVVSVPASDETEFDWGVGAARQSTPSSQLEFEKTGGFVADTSQDELIVDMNTAPSTPFRRGRGTGRPSGSGERTRRLPA
jgi:hypothetical protein